MTADQQFQVVLVGVGLIGGGAIGLITAYFTRRGAFADARRLQSRDQARHDLALARALDFEMTVNATSANSRLQGGGLAMLTRSAYEAARQLVMPTEVEALVGLAYEEAELYNSIVQLQRSAILTDPSGAGAARMALRPADVKQAFEGALEAMKHHKLLDKLCAAVDDE